jgi:hypothetical protein
LAVNPDQMEDGFEDGEDDEGEDPDDFEEEEYLE